MVNRKSFRVDDSVPPPTTSSGSGLKDVKVFMREAGVAAVDTEASGPDETVDVTIDVVLQAERRAIQAVANAPAILRQV